MRRIALISALTHALEVPGALARADLRENGKHVPSPPTLFRAPGGWRRKPRLRVKRIAGPSGFRWAVDGRFFDAEADADAYAEKNNVGRR